MKWDDAKEHLYGLKEAYEGIGPAGSFGLTFINLAVKRFEDGERSKDLYDEINSLE